MNFSPITFKVRSQTVDYVPKSKPKLKPNDYTLIKNHGLITLNDGSDYFRCKKTGRICRVSFMNNTVVYFDVLSIDELRKQLYLQL